MPLAPTLTLLTRPRDLAARADETQGERLEVLHDGREVELVACAGEAEQPQPLEGVFRCAKRISSCFLSSRDLMNAGVPISRRAASRASSWRSRGILRDGSLGQHRIFNRQTSQSRFEAR
jgi:hypothetical protein